MKNKPTTQSPPWQRLVKTAKRAWSEILLEPLASMTSVLVIAITLVLPLTLFSAANKLESTLKQYSANPQLIAYLKLDSTDTKLGEVSQRLLIREDISYIELVPKALGLSQFSEDSGLGDLVSQLGSNPLPDALLITPLQTDLTALETLADELSQDADIESTELDIQWLQRLQALVNVINRLGMLIGALSALAFLLVIGNTIRTIVQGSLDEIRIQKLFGATDLYVISPLIFKGLYYGLSGAILATALQLLVFSLFNTALADFMQLYGDITGPNSALGVSWPESFMALIVSGAMGAAAAALFAKWQLAKLHQA